MKNFLMVLAGVVLYATTSYAAINGEIGLDIQENRTDIFVEVEQKFEIDDVNFYFGVSVDKTRANEVTTTDTLDAGSGFEEEFPMFMLGGDVSFSNDALNEYQRTIVSGSIGKDISIGEANLLIKGSAGYSWINGAESDPVLKVSNAFTWGIFFQEAEAISAVDNIDNLEISASAGFKTKLTKELSLKTGYTVDYTRALADRYNHALRSAVAFSF